MDRDVTAYLFDPNTGELFAVVAAPRAPSSFKGFGSALKPHAFNFFGAVAVTVASEVFANAFIRRR